MQKAMHAKHADGTEPNDLSGHMIGCAFIVLNTLRAEFLEKDYENTLAFEFPATDLLVVRQRAARVVLP